jgi:hypothetical protein
MRMRALLALLSVVAQLLLVGGQEQAAVKLPEGRPSLKPPATPRQRRQRREPSQSQEDTHAKATNQIFRSIMGESLHEEKGTRHRRTIPPPVPLSEVAGGAPAREWGSGALVPPVAPSDLSYLTTKQAARDHVEKTLGHHRHRRRRRHGDSVLADHLSEL